MKNDHRTMGAWGERCAARYLWWHGYRILDRNYRCRSGEIDLIACRQGFLVFVEVKLRKDDSHGAAREFVDYQKKKRLLLTAKYYLSHHETKLQPRFDVVEIYAPRGRATWLPKIVHWEDAFQ